MSVGLLFDDHQNTFCAETVGRLGEQSAFNALVDEKRERAYTCNQSSLGVVFIEKMFGNVRFYKIGQFLLLIDGIF